MHIRVTVIQSLVWCILAAASLVSAHAGCYYKGLQRLCEPTRGKPQDIRSFEKKDILLYLVPSEVKALEARGFVLKLEDNQTKQHSDENEDEQQEEEELEQNSEEETKNIEGQKPQEIIELEEIFRILNREMVEDKINVNDNNKQDVSTEEEQEEDQINSDKENERVFHRPEQNNNQFNEHSKQPTFPTKSIATRFGVLQRYIGPSDLTKQIQDQSILPTLPHRQYGNLQQETNEEYRPQKVENTNENKQKFNDNQRVVVIIDKPEGAFQEENEQSESLRQNKKESLASTLEHKIFQTIANRREKLIQNEYILQTVLQQLKQSPTHNNQRYALQIERLRQNLEHQNALAKAEALAKMSPFLNKKQDDSKNIEDDNTDRESVSTDLKNIESSTLRAPQKYAHYQRPIPVPVIKTTRIELKTPVPVEIDNVAAVSAPKKVIIAIDNPYMKRIDPVEFNKQFTSVSKPEDLRIIRHLWEH